MAQKIIELPGIGPVVFAKRKGTKNLRLSILPSGKVRVSLPIWAPYSAAVNFALSRTEWIKQNSQHSGQILLKHGHRIGKSYRIEFISKPLASKTQARLGINAITVTSGLELSHEEVQQKARAAAERALKKEAQTLLSQRLYEMSKSSGLTYKAVKFKRLTSRWGSCSSDKIITLNYFLVQLPWHLIDYVIGHELAHTVQMNHSQDFWRIVESMAPDAKNCRKEIKTYRPMLTPN